MEDRITYSQFIAEAFDIAKDALESTEDRDAALEHIWQSCDGHRWVIYYGHAIDFCSAIDISDAEEEFEDMGGWQKGDTFGSVACKLTFLALNREAERQLDRMLRDREAA